MNHIPIDKQNNNIEILAKIANSMVKKYDCSIKLNHATGRFDWSGDESYKTYAIMEIQAFLENG